MMAMPESWAGNKYLMVIEDYLSNYVVVAPIKDKKAETIAEVFLNQVILIYGPPGVIHSDRGSEFRNKVMAELCDIINAKKSFTTPYHPQADGKVERFNRTIQMLRREGAEELGYHPPFCSLRLQHDNKPQARTLALQHSVRA